MRIIFRLALSYILLASITPCSSQRIELELWTENIPYSKTNVDYQEEVEFDDQNDIQRIRKVSIPTLTYFDDVQADSVACVIICPGGGYGHLSINKEGYKVAKWFNSIGIKAAVLKYRLPSIIISDRADEVPMQDLNQAIKLIKTNAKKWNIAHNKIGIMGFSAGGHLAAFGAHLADFSILIYPVITMDANFTHTGSRVKLLGNTPSDNKIHLYSAEMNVSDQTPKTFIVHSQNDQAVSVQNSLIYYQELCDHNIQSDIHIFATGGHGYGMGRNVEHHPWVGALQDWLTQNILQ